MARAASDCDFDWFSVAFLFLLGLGKARAIWELSWSFLKMDTGCKRGVLDEWLLEITTKL